MEKPFAITLDVGSSLANKTGSWRTSRPVYLDRLPPCSRGRRASGWLYRRGFDYRPPGGARSTTRCRRSWPRVLSPCETSCNRAKLDEPVGINSVERFLGDEALKQAGASIRRRMDRARRAGRRRGAIGAFRGVPPAPARARGEDCRGGAARRRHDALRHPEIPAAAGRARRGSAAHPRSRRRAPTQLQGVEDPRDDAGWTLRRRIPRRRRAHRETRVYPGGQRCAHARRGVSAARHGGEEKPLLGRRVVVYGGSNTAASRARRSASATTRSSSIAAPAKMPAHDFEVEALRKGC